ncbi:MAG: hypothetical protein IPI97_01785 [Nitrosomonas sp.]|nr:hypothetical protein [Nitrosomonas sp.]MBK7363779.1 hypothetical protein [Nitrosomonas sp.]
MNAPNLETSYQSNDIIPRLHKVKRLSEGRYIAICPCHEDTRPSLAITIKPDGVVLMKCFACGADGLQVCESLGINPASLFPHSDNPKYEKQPRLGFSSWQLLHSLEKDMLVVLISAKMLVRGEALPESDINYLSEVVMRINEALQYLEGAR